MAAGVGGGATPQFFTLAPKILLYVHFESPGFFCFVPLVLIFELSDLIQMHRRCEYILHRRLFNLQLLD